MNHKPPIRIAIAGVGNCASSLVQGLVCYGSTSRNGHQPLAGLMHEEIGGYRAADIEVVAAFDVDRRKVGKPLTDAIVAAPNCTKRFAQVPAHAGPTVQKGPVLDGVAAHMKGAPSSATFLVSRRTPCDVVRVLRDSGAEILLNYLPVGSQRATEFYADCCLRTGISLLNCMPVFIASDPAWAKRFAASGIPVIGDDIKSQFGATIVHRTLVRLARERGLRILRTYQLNTGGNTDFLNMLDRRRLVSKKVSKTEAVQSQLEEPLPDEAIHIGPSDYVSWQKDNKVCFLRLEAEGFGGVPLNLELRLSVEDSPNSAGVVIDAIRLIRLARDRGFAGPLIAASAYLMKHPPAQMADEDARRQLEEFIAVPAPTLPRIRPHRRQVVAIR
ncbi:MAG: inositol-3-phosphate synthase [Candidatus Omnitrophica bacterium]|nr:inositol-3-phosphate synthase [Candidatus Omnitrophota bacterium]